MSGTYRCTQCGRRYPVSHVIFKCLCGGLLDLDFQVAFSQELIEREQYSIFRYIKALPMPNDSSVFKGVTMGEGMTPLLPLAEKGPHILVKLEYLMPTLSFKDRGAALLIAKALEMGVNRLVQDSSGNAGNAIAAYGARAGIECHIYVPKTTSEKKIGQMRAYGAFLHQIEGSREDTALAALEAVERGEGFYASHVYNPFFYQGTKTFVYEVYEQMQGRLPQAFVLPVGNGTLLLGCYYGCLDLLKGGLIQKLPRIIGVQAKNCAPLYQAFVKKREVEEVENRGTVAEGIAIAKPMRGEQILKAIRDTDGEIITAKEEKILETQRYLARKGFHVESTTASTFAGFFQYYYKGGARQKEEFLLPLGGAGLKSL